MEKVVKLVMLIFVLMVAESSHIAKPLTVRLRISTNFVQLFESFIVSKIPICAVTFGLSAIWLKVFLTVHWLKPNHVLDVALQDQLWEEELEIS